MTKIFQDNINIKIKGYGDAASEHKTHEDYAQIKNGYELRIQITQERMPIKPK